MDEALIRAQGLTGSLLAPAPPGRGVLAVEPYVEDKLQAGSFDALGTLHSLRSSMIATRNIPRSNMA